MTTSNDTTSRSTPREDTQYVSREGHEWTCPYCGKSRFKPAVGESGPDNVLTALRNHIAATDGDGHGPKNSLPDDESVTLSEHVDYVDNREAGIDA